MNYLKEQDYYKYATFLYYAYPHRDMRIEGNTQHFGILNFFWAVANDTTGQYSLRLKLL